MKVIFFSKINLTQAVKRLLASIARAQMMGLAAQLAAITNEVSVPAQ